MVEKDVAKQLDLLPQMSTPELRSRWAELFKRPAPSQLRREILIRILAYRIQELAFGGLSLKALARLHQLAKLFAADPNAIPSNVPTIKPGTRLVRTWGGQMHEV